MGTKLLLGFGGTVIQVVVHPFMFFKARDTSFGGTVNQVVVHHHRSSMCPCPSFGVTETVVKPLDLSMGI